VAIASNNAVSIKQEKDLFDAAKKLKQAESFIGKLSLRHRQIVDTNNVVLLMYMNKSQLCRDACNKLKQAHPTVSAGAIILAALAYREKKKSVVAALADLKVIITDKQGIKNRIFTLSCLLLLRRPTPMPPPQPTPWCSARRS